MNTKYKILDSARALFNEHGYWNVTLRMIAIELDISPGNLNYHFKKKEEILEALYFNMVTEFDERVKKLRKTEITFEKIKRDISTSMSSMVHYKFIWTDLYRLAKHNSKINIHFSNAYHKRIEGYQFLFYLLQQKKLMNAGIEKREQTLIAERMIQCSDTWIYYTQIYSSKNTELAIAENCKNILMILHPYLTEPGKEFLKLSLQYT